MPPINNALDAVHSVRPSLAGVRILDVGCGGGGFVRQLLVEGADASGIDPEPEAVRKARTAVPQGQFLVGRAEALPHADASLDIVVMVNSLHHVPEASMIKALAEAVRVIRPEGSVVIVEPRAYGSFFTALQPIEDETEVRGAAQQAIAIAVSSGLVVHKGAIEYEREDIFADVEGFLGFVVAVDPARQAVVDAKFETIKANVLAAARRAKDGRLQFTQPMKVDILGRP